MPGVSKLLRRWRDGTVLDAVVESALGAGLDPVVVVVGSSPGPLERALSAHDVVLAHVRHGEPGRAASLAAGLDLCPTDRPVIVLLGDEPEVSLRAIADLQGAWRDLDVDMARVRYADRPGHPVLIGSRAAAIARRLAGEESVWTRLLESGMSGVEVPFDGPAPIDVDRPVDLAAARARSDPGTGCGLDARPGLDGEG